MAAAIAARLKGFDVVVADAAQPPIDKACGEGLMPDSLDALRRLGVAIDPEQSFAFRGIRFLGAGGTWRRIFPRGHGIAIAAHPAASASDRSRARAGREAAVAHSRDRRFGDIRARWIIGADGENSRVRRWADLDAARSESFRYGFRRHYRVRALDRFHGDLWGPAARCTSRRWAATRPASL